jgi:hypothetical protein
VAALCVALAGGVKGSGVFDTVSSNDLQQRLDVLLPCRGDATVEAPTLLAWALGVTRSPAAVDALLPTLGAWSTDVHAEVTVAAVRAAAGPAWEQLARRLAAHDHAAVAAAALASVARDPRDDDAPLLRSKLQSGHAALRLAAALGLARLGKPEGPQAIVETLSPANSASSTRGRRSPSGWARRSNASRPRTL